MIEVPSMDLRFNIHEWDGHCPVCGRFARREGELAKCKCGWSMKHDDSILIVSSNVAYDDSGLDRFYLMDDTLEGHL